MRKLFWLVSGISIGLVLAKQIEENPKAKAIADDLKKAEDAKLPGFGTPKKKK